jgi:hypothetical protein
MQRGFAKSCSRVTLWRRAKAAEREIVPRRFNRGRDPFNFHKRTSFLEFTGAVIALQNEKGYCIYSDIFKGDKPGQYYRSPDSILKRLIESNFPPQLLAVAVADLIPLNYVTRGGRHTSKSGRLELMAKTLTWKQAVQNDADHLLGRKMNRTGSSGSADDIVTENSSYDGYEAIFEADEGDVAQNDRRLLKIKPAKGTPIYRIIFHGGFKISRPMVCYWRNDCRTEFNRCRAFLASLLTAPAPLAPWHFAGTVGTGKSFSAKVTALWDNKSWRQRNRARLAQKYKTKARI